MKRIISAVVALTLMGTAAASAQGYRGGHDGYDNHFGNRGSYSQSYRNDYRGGYGNDYRGGYRNDYRGGWNGRHNDGAAMIGLGIGLLGLAAIASSHDHYQSYDYYGR